MKHRLLPLVLAVTTAIFSQWIYHDLVVNIPDDDFVMDILAFGTSPRATDGFDSGLDVTSPPPPPAGIFVAFQIDDPWISFLITDIKRHSGEPDTVYWTLYIRSGAYPAIVSWDNTTIPVQASVSLKIAGHYPAVEPSEDDYVDMTVDSELDLMPAQLATIRMISLDGVKEAPEIQLPDNYIQSISPNPFNSNVRIELITTKTAHSEVSVYDITGNLVKNIQSGQLPEGIHILSWDGTDNTGRLMPSGIYHIKHKSQNNIDVRNICFIK